jgi:hypothetical protein
MRYDYNPNVPGDVMTQMAVKSLGFQCNQFGRRGNKNTPLFTTIALLLSVLLVGLGTAQAQKGPEKVFAGRVFVSDKRFPTTAKSPAAYISAVKKLEKKSLIEDKEAAGWKVYYAAFLKSPLDDVQVNVKLYDASGKQQQLISAFEQYTDSRGQRTVIANFSLARKDVGVNREIMIVLDSGGKTLAAGRFRIIGDAEKLTGKVDFSEDDAAGRDLDDKAAQPPKDPPKDNKKK